LEGRKTKAAKNWEAVVWSFLLGYLPNLKLQWWKARNQAEISP
jgi:glucose-6-phosphate dehydrogenase assembly protein OpcA